MNRSILFLAFLVCAVNTAVAQVNIWRPQNPPTLGGTIYDVQMLTSSSVYAVGQNCSFMVSQDSGYDWLVSTGIVPGHINDTLFSVSFLNDSVGMTVGSHLAIKTTDKGKTWTKMSVPTSSLYAGVLMVTDSLALIVGSGQGIFRTLDGGNTWKAITYEFPVGNIHKIRSFGKNFLIILGDAGSMYSSVDSGTTWHKIPNDYGNDMYDIAYADTSNAVAIGEGGYTIVSTNGGQHWTMQSFADSGISVTAILRSVSHKDRNHIVIVGDYATIVWTTDGGTTWHKPFILQFGLDLKALAMWDVNYGIAVGESGLILRTTDAGQSWSFMPRRPFYNILFGVAFPKGDTSNGVCVGAFGTILHTTNGGTKWDSVGTPMPNDLHSVCFADSLNVWACGDYGAFIRSTDGGSNWQNAPLPEATKSNLVAVAFPSPTNGWVLYQDSSKLFHTTDAGKTWSFVPIPPTQFLRGTSLAFADTLTGLVIGFYGWMETIDGGKHWKWTPIDSTNYAFGHYVGCAIADAGTYILSYTQTTTTVSGTFFDAYLNGAKVGGSFGEGIPAYLDKYHATVTGGIGLITHTTDGGVTWNVQQSPNSSQVQGSSYNAISFSSPKAGTIVGLRGVIIRRTNVEPLDTTSSGVASVTPPAFGITSVSPNPAQIETTVRFTTSATDDAEIILMNMNGVRVFDAKLGTLSAGSYEESLPLHYFADGAYLLSVRTADGVTTRTLIIEH